ncbi:hypothetical protein SFA52_25575 [Escherichia coli]|nr:hypothetical protein [Escherichia coli]
MLSQKETVMSFYLDPTFAPYSPPFYKHKNKNNHLSMLTRRHKKEEDNKKAKNTNKTPREAKKQE